MIWRREAPIVRSGGELPGPLRDRDRERVRDHERADEQRDAAEREQEALEEAEEALRLARILVGLAFSGAYLGAGRQDGLDRARRAPPRSCPRTRRHGSGRACRPCGTVAARWSGRTRPASPRRCCPRRRSRRAPTPQVAAQGPPPARRSNSPTSMSFCEAVDVSTATSLGPGQAPFLSTSELKRAWAGSIEKPMFGAPPNWITSPSSSISCASPPTPPTAASTSGSALHLRQQRLVERGDLDTRVLAHVEGGVTRDHGVGALVDRGEDRVERVRDRVREDVRAGDRRYAEHDREAREERPELPAPEIAEGDPRHRR